MRAASDVNGIRYCSGATADAGNTYNVVDALLIPACKTDAEAGDNKGHDYGQVACVESLEKRPVPAYDARRT